MSQARLSAPPESFAGASLPRDRLFAYTVCCTAGALLLLALPELPPLAWTFALSAPALLPWRGRSWYAAAALGALLSLFAVERQLAERWPEARSGEEVVTRGLIVSLPDAQPIEVATAPKTSDAKPSRESSADADAPAAAVTADTAVVEPTANWHFLFAPDAGDSSAGTRLPSRIRAAWYRGPMKLEAGTCWRFSLRLRTPRGSWNPGGSDYEAWLFRQGIGASATVREAESCDGLSGGVLLRLRQGLANRLEAWLPAHPAQALVAALTIGDARGLRAADWDDFRATGTTHLVAISGFNIAIVAGVAFFILRWSWAFSSWLCLHLPAQRAALFGASWLALGYALLAGFEAPVARAALMLVFLVAAAALGGAAQPARALALAWLSLIVSAPLTLLAPGLWLSFGAVAAIFYATSASAGPRSWWREALRVQLMLSVVLAPPTLFFFQGASALGPLVNLVAVPVVAVLTPLLLGVLLLAWAWPAAGLPLLHWSADGLAVLRDGLGAIAHRIPQAWTAASPEPAALLLALLGALLLFAPRGLPLRAFAALCFLPLLFPPSRAPATGFRLTTLDVGQGLAVVVRTANHALLFDAGPAYEEGFDAGRSAVVPYLLHEGIRRLDVMMVSHADLDHRGGAPAVRRFIDVREERGALAGVPCAAGQNWDWDGVRFAVLNGPFNGPSNERSIDAATPGSGADPPPFAAPPRSAVRGHAHNNEGCVLRVAFAGHAALLPADIERGSEARLVEEDAAQLHADVLLAPHHGSKTSSTPAFVAAVAPSVVIFPAGYRNPFKHPRAEVVERYSVLGAQLYMSGHAGAISLDVDADGVHAVHAWRREYRRLWSAPSLPVPEDNR